MLTRDRLRAYAIRIRLFFKALNTALQFVAAVLQIVAATALVATVITFIEKQWSWCAGAFVVCILAVAVFYAFYKGLLSATNVLQDVYWKEATFEYTIQDDEEHMEQNIQLVVQALRDGIDRFQNKYWWTGSGDESTDPFSTGHRLLGPPLKREGWNYYSVYLGRTLCAGESETVQIKQVLHDVGKTHENILSKTVTEPIGELTLRVKPPKSRGAPHRITFHEHASAFIFHPVKSEVRTEDFNERKWEVAWSIPNPKLHHTYVIRWEY